VRLKLVSPTAPSQLAPVMRLIGMSWKTDATGPTSGRIQRSLHHSTLTPANLDFDIADVFCAPHAHCHGPVPDRYSERPQQTLVNVNTDLAPTNPLDQLRPIAP
jgi:hypothetical protein